MRIIKVYGSLAKFLGQRSFKAAVSTPIEAVRFLIANFPGVEAHIAEHSYRVSVGRDALRIGERPELLTYPTPMDEPIRIMPVMSGAGNGVGQVLAGVGLIALSFLLPGAQLGLFGLGQIGLTAFAAPIAGLGVSLALGGVAQMLTPTSTQNVGGESATNPRLSFSFSGIQNVSRQGVPVPIIYGETLVGSVVISAGINTEEVPV